MAENTPTTFTESGAKRVIDAVRTVEGQPHPELGPRMPYHFMSSAHIIGGVNRSGSDIKFGYVCVISAWEGGGLTSSVNDIVPVVTQATVHCQRSLVVAAQDVANGQAGGFYFSGFPWVLASGDLYGHFERHNSPRAGTRAGSWLPLPDPMGQLEWCSNDDIRNNGGANPGVAYLPAPSAPGDRYIRMRLTQRLGDSIGIRALQCDGYGVGALLFDKSAFTLMTCEDGASVAVMMK